MSDTGTLNFLWSQALVAGFVAAGASEAVISPGSRSTPLALAMLRQSGLRCHVAVDERSAGFFGLGLAKANGQPTLLLATSGTAPANWLPAVIEASQSGVPLILISADRPPELQGWGANQTVDQIRLFGAHVRASHTLGVPEPGFSPDYAARLAAQVCNQACWPHPGPVHLNQPFREPLVPASSVPPLGLPDAIRVSNPHLALPREVIRDLAGKLGGRPGMIVCGEMPWRPGQNEAITALAAHLDCPILAEPLSGLRFGRHDRSHLMIHYGDWASIQPPHPPGKAEWIIRFGAFPVTRALQAVLSGRHHLHVLVDPWPRWSDPHHHVTDFLRSEPGDFCTSLIAEMPAPAPPDWMAGFTVREALATQSAKPTHIQVLLDEVPADTALFIGNSLAIRELDRYSGSNDKPLRFYANRGASGIDGNLSTAFGLAAVHQRVVALVGDLTCQHDLGGLALAGGRDAVIVTVNNQGGGIFEHLAQRHLPEFDAGWKTPQQIDFEYAARSFGLAYAVADSLEPLRAALRAALNAGGPHLIEYRIG